MAAAAVQTTFLPPPFPVADILSYTAFTTSHTTHTPPQPLSDLEMSKMWEIDPETRRKVAPPPGAGPPLLQTAHRLASPEVWVCAGWLTG